MFELIASIAFVYIVFKSLKSLKIMKEVVFRLGKFHSILQPGFRILNPITKKMVRVSLRIVSMVIPSQDVLSKDNIPVKVSAVLFYQVKDPKSAVLEIEDFSDGASQIAQTTLRAILGCYSG